MPADDAASNALPGLRASFLDEDLAQSRILIVGMLALVLLYVPREWLLYGDEPLFRRLIAVRAGLVIWFVLLFFASRRIASPVGLDRLTGLMIAVCVPAVVSINLLYRQHFGVDLLIVLAIYIALPAPPLVQVAGALALSVGDIYIDAVLMPGNDPNDVVATHFFANALGLALRLRQRRIRRALYATTCDEALARADLEDALAQVKQLSGLLPICSVCKMIRDEAGAWHALEPYIDEHSEASFTHSYCPRCEDEALREPGP